MSSNNKKKYIIRPLSILFLVLCLVLLNVVIASTAGKYLGKIEKSKKSCGSYEGHTLRKAATKGGCYFVDENNKTVFVDKKLCDC
jgi:hypothetical protein